MDVADIRKALGKTAEKMTDEQVIDAEQRMRTLANVILDRVLEMTPEERKALNKKIKEEEQANKK